MTINLHSTCINIGGGNRYNSYKVVKGATLIYAVIDTPLPPSERIRTAGKDKQKEKSFAATCDGALFLFTPTPATII